MGGNNQKGQGRVAKRKRSTNADAISDVYFIDVLINLI
jgi:hypothetical protein